ncbi:MAG: glycosyltransferase family 39 protein, partial [Methanospirillum sp.]|uniref:ArnT family glycosyltransferase n=1 Tax=Methanospirillum sp. TaxID=45200 RepID=UPI002373A3C3
MAEFNLQQYLSIINRWDVSWIFCICCALLVLGIGLTFQAPWIDWDASDYINVAENIVDGKGIVSGWESATIHKFWPLTVWPPFYPILIAAFMTLGFTSVSAAMWIQILAFAGIVIVSFFFGKEIDSPLVGYLCAISILCMSALWELSRMALTEIPYIFLSLVGLYLLLRYVNTKNYWVLVLSVLFCGAGAVTRYMGITLILTGFLILVFQSRKRTLSDLIPALVFGVISSIPVCLVFFRNIEVTGHFSGADRGAGSGIFTGVTHDLIQVMVSDLNPFKLLFFERISDWVSIGIFSFLMVVAVFLTYGVYIGGKTRFKLLALHFLSEKCIVISYILIYILTLALLEIGMGDIASVHTRYLLPVYPFLVILCLSFMRSACSQVKTGSWRVISISICTILVVCFVCSQVLGSLPVISEKGGRYYTDPV